ncbi:hypothetical protein PVAND_001372 [Polypedilum vanderplanki]|uniref:Cytochrome P450 n=1 Tax=Polypedilum vanderplanki TaxID=319348 RepID=A0A9J6BN94_POLVA|nr:hypothetical protein PVAND_001372 [Polypedilum vanderplanki]
MWTYLILIASLLYLFYYWYTSKYDYFKQRGLLGPKPRFPFGNVPNAFLQKRNFIYDLDDIYQEYRKKVPFVGYFEAGTPKLLAISPEIAKDVMVKYFSNFHDNEFSKLFDKEADPIFGRNPFALRGQEWKEKRAEVTPAFTSTRLRSLFPLVEEVLERFKNYVHKEIPKNEPFDIREISAKFTTDVVSSCIFNADAQSFTKEKPEIREMGRKLVDFTSTFFLIQFIILSMFPWINNIYKFSFTPKDVSKFFINLMEQAVTIREKSNIKRDDYLSYLIELKKKKNLANIDMAAHGVTFFTDGFETSSLAIAYMLYEIANDKRVQEKFRKQINEELIDENGKIIYEKMLEHEYLDQIFHETLRLHPILGVYNRECTEEITFDCNGRDFKIEKGMSVNVPIYSIHRDPDYYVNPTEFAPERFDAENGGVKEFRNRGVLMPFGDGSRICLGMRFALMQSKAAVIEIVRNFELSVNDKTQRPLEIERKQFINVVEGGLWLDMKAIK